MNVLMDCTLSDVGGTDLINRNKRIVCEHDQTGLPLIAPVYSREDYRARRTELVECGRHLAAEFSDQVVVLLAAAEGFE